MEILVVKSQGDGMQELSGGDYYGLEFNRQKYNNMDEQQRWLKRRGAAIDDFGGTTSMTVESLSRKRQTDIGAGSSGLSLRASLYCSVT